MKSVHDFLITPAGERYNNISESGLILNTEMQNHNYVNREAIVLSCPVLGNDTGIEVGDRILVHHNIFRRFRDVRGIEKNSRAYFQEDKFFCPKDQVYMVDKGNGWEALPGFTFVQPITDTRLFATDKELPLWGIVAYSDKNEPNVNEEDIVSFAPSSEFEFIVDNKKVYRILSYNITTNNGCKRNEVAYNPSWSKSS
jgi:hypothetical protein